MDVEDLLLKIREGWSTLESEDQARIISSDEMVSEIAEIIGLRRVLFVNCTPMDQEPIRVSGELRAIRGIVDANGSRISVDDLPAATVDDLAKRLIKMDYDILHFSGHADETHLIFENEAGQSTEVPLSAIALLVRSRPSISCVILNACSALSQMTESVANFTIGMDDAIDDEAAIAFSKGFYERLALGGGIEQSFDEGKVRVALAGYDTGKVRLLRGAVEGP